MSNILFLGVFAFIALCTIVQAVASAISIYTFLTGKGHPPPWAKNPSITLSILAVLIVISSIAGYVTFASSSNTSVLTQSTTSPGIPFPVTGTTKPGTPDPLATATPIADSSPTPINNPKNPAMPLSMECTHCNDNRISVTLKSIGYDAVRDKYTWTFSFTNNSYATISVSFGSVYLVLPDNTEVYHDQSDTTWSMGANEAVDQYLFFSKLQHNVRYTLNMGVDTVDSNYINSALNIYKTYYFYF